jgi:hypothetical protein
VTLSCRSGQLAWKRAVTHKVPSTRFNFLWVTNVSGADGEGHAVAGRKPEANGSG